MRYHNVSFCSMVFVVVCGGGCQDGWVLFFVSTTGACIFGISKVIRRFSFSTTLSRHISNKYHFTDIYYLTWSKRARISFLVFTV